MAVAVPAPRELAAAGPLLELVSSELGDTIAAFEHGGRQAIGA